MEADRGKEGKCLLFASKPMILVLFDIDGTLLRTRGGSIRAMQRAAEIVFGTRGAFESVQCGGKLDPEIIAEALRPCGIVPVGDQWDRFKRRYFVFLREEIPNFRLVAGADQLVGALRNCKEVTLGLATGNFTESAFIKVEAVGLAAEWFYANAFGEEATTRPELINLAIRRAQRWCLRRPRRVIVVGDTPRDVHAAKANDCFALAVAGGSYSDEILRQCGADYCTTSLEPTPELMKFILDGAC